jgi:hypothetical protein
MISKALLSKVLTLNIKDVYKLNSNPDLGKFDLPNSVRGNGDLQYINIYELADITNE